MPVSGRLNLRAGTELDKLNENMSRNSRASTLFVPNIVDLTFKVDSGNGYRFCYDDRGNEADFISRIQLKSYFEWIVLFGTRFFV